MPRQCRITFTTLVAVGMVTTVHAQYPSTTCTTPVVGSVEAQTTQLFQCWDMLSSKSRNLLNTAVQQVANMYPGNPPSENNFYRAYWWQQYIVANDDSPDLTKFFNDWLAYNPVPNATVAEVLVPPNTCNFCPTPENPTGVPGSPEYYLEYWDFVFNTLAGYALNGFAVDFRTWFALFLTVRGNYLGTSASFPNTVRQQWLHFLQQDQNPFDINNFAVTQDGYYSYNAFFLRWFKASGSTSGLDYHRPLNPNDVDNPLKIVSPCDGGLFYLSHAATGRHILPGKSQDTFDVMEAFGPFGRYFVGGPLLDSLLWFTDFHHLMSPVAGKIVFMMDYPGSYNYDFYDFDPYHPDIPTIPDSSDRVGWYKQLARHRRFVWVVDAGEMGYVGVAAIGFWDVGSIVTSPSNKTLWDGGFDAPTLTPGMTIKKGQYLGHFAYGGSSMVMAFQPCVNGQMMSYTFSRASDGKPLSTPDHPLQMNTRSTIGTATKMPHSCALNRE